MAHQRDCEIHGWSTTVPQAGSNRNSGSTTYNIQYQAVDGDTWPALSAGLWGSFDQDSLTRSLEPLFRYPGGKRTDIKHYAPFIPQRGEFDLYVEPFVGGGAERLEPRAAAAHRCRGRRE